MQPSWSRQIHPRGAVLQIRNAAPGPAPRQLVSVWVARRQAVSVIPHHLRGQSTGNDARSRRRRHDHDSCPEEGGQKQHDHEPRLRKAASSLTAVNSGAIGSSPEAIHSNATQIRAWEEFFISCR
jgi:hypothetical protein